MIFSHITEAIHSLLLAIKPNFKNKNWGIALRALLVLTGLLFIGCFFLKKIYEVPVNYTEVDILYDSSSEIKSSDIDVVLCRDYDRGRGVAIQKGDSGIVTTNDNSEKPGSLIISGVVKFKKPNDGDCYSNYNGNLWDFDKHLIDTVPLGENNVSSLIYISARGTRRQALGHYKTMGDSSSIIYKNKQLSFEDQKYLYEKRNFIDLSKMVYTPGEWKVDVDFFFKKITHKINPNEFCEQDYLVVSKNDSIVPIAFSLGKGDFVKPNIFTSLEDISKAVELINIPVRSMNLVRSLTIDYRGTAEFDYLSPEPDERTISSIRYTDKAKLKQIGFNGLKYHVRFPDMENLQNIRILVLTAIVTLLLTVLLTLLYKLISKYVNRLWSKHPYNCIILVVCIFILTLLFLYYTDIATNVDAQNFHFILPNNSQ